MIVDALGIKKDKEQRNKLGVYPIPNDAIDLLLRTNVRAPVMVPLANLGLSHLVHFSDSNNRICLPTLGIGCSEKVE